DCAELAAAIGLTARIPHFTTLQKAAGRLLCFGPANDLLGATIRRHLGENPRVELAGADSTGMESSQISPYFVKRRARGHQRLAEMGLNPWQNTTYTRFPKCEMVVDCATHLV